MTRIETQNFRRINRRRAENLYNADVPVYLCACILNPESPWQPAIDVLRSNVEAAFEGVVNAFEYYNCNAEAGRRVFFYEWTGGAQ